ncbi:UbiX family flavin prenyltransferase [Lacticaseibacillus zhaodongensis]|uniref:UbiX family flavin prenyltransferase n=1 Tax=Lacticaseibacillus zhaodongensis TaxID=2668065 RepID=UPI0012D36B14|nr:UbiX family flavin prenyltransferase [Lacticaseibacillus zhaodongensis]
MKKIIVGISGASGTIYGLRLLEALAADPDVETHLVMSPWAKENLALEATGYTEKDVRALADVVYDDRDMGAAIASGSFQNDGMVIVPASMKTVAGIAMGYADNLIARAADVALKERRQLILVPRESPFNQIHLENMLKLARMGVEIIPPIPAFYNQPKTIDDLINHNTMKLLDHLHLQNNYSQRWQGLAAAKQAVRRQQEAVTHE